jgi:hypothetical protein
MGYEQGAVADRQATPLPPPQVRHAVKKTLAGPAALCGAGPIEIRLLGNFDTEAENVCPRCTEVLAAQ